MATTITTRAGKGAALTHAEMDGNLTALRDTADAAATAANLSAHAANTSNPHAVTQAQVGLGNVDNTADTAKPVSTAQAAAIAAAVTAHTQAADPHPGYLTPAEGAALYSPTGAYVKPTDGVPRQDLDHTIRGQLDLADTALQPGAQLTQAVANSTTAAGAALMTGADAAAQRVTLGLGTAATTASTAYATAAQGAKADAALQPGALPAGTTVTASQISDAGAAGRALLQKETLPEIQALVSGERIATADAGVTVTDGTMSVRLPSTGNKSLQFMIATSETASYISEIKSNTYTIGLLDAQTTIADGWQYCSPTTNIGAAGVVQEVYVSLISSTRLYKLTMVVGGGYNNNIFVINRIN